MWRSYVGGLFMGVAVGGALCWISALTILSGPARAQLVAVPMFPWAVLVAFALAGETLRVKAAAAAGPTNLREAP
jgi:hypothetical protein